MKYLTIEERKQIQENRKDEIHKYCYEDMKEAYDNERCRKFMSEEEIQEEIKNGTENVYRRTMEYYKEEMMCHEEKVDGIDLKPYLEKIRHNNYETMVCLIIKDGKVIDEVSERGEKSSCDIDNVTSKKAMMLAKQLNANVYIVHNHPFLVGVKPSGRISVRNDENDNKYEAETGDYLHWHTILPNMAKEHGVEILDYGVVSDYDYFSLKQSKWNHYELIDGKSVLITK